MNEADTILATVSQLPDEIRSQLRGVNVRVVPRAAAIDYERGATEDHNAYFFGHVPDKVETTELPDLEPPSGEIVIFRDRLKPYTAERLAHVLLHEIGHVIGLSEDQIIALGFG